MLIIIMMLAIGLTVAVGGICISLIGSVDSQEKRIAELEKQIDEQLEEIFKSIK